MANAIQKCHCCGEQLNSDNARQACAIICSTEFSPYCIECEQKYYDRLEKQNGTHIALYLTCCAFCVPYEPLILPEDFIDSENKWIGYINLLYENGKNENLEGVTRSFFDGCTEMRRIFGKSLSEEDITKYLNFEKARVATLVGTDEQRARWGTEKLWNGFEMTKEVYDALDRQYESRASEFKGQTLSMQQKDALIKVCKWNLTIDYLFRIGRVDTAQKIQKMVQTELEAEQMRKKDEKPVEALRIDALVESLENAGLMANGEFLTYDETVQALRDNCIKSKKYDYSLDVADQIILDVLNNIRANSDLELLTSLSDEYAAEDAYGEFEPEETEKEKEAKRYAGLTKVHITPSESE